MCCSNSLVDDRAGCVSEDESEKGILVFSRKLLCEELFGDDIDFIVELTLPEDEEEE